VAGFGRPKWSIVVNSTNSTPTVLPGGAIILPDDDTPQPQPKPVQAKLYYPHIYNVKINLLKEGNYGPQVSSMQQLLKEKGFPCEVTGKFDSKTKQAVIEF
jgi:peptidoglycan hydrolase-like protein with peptidoglycan-binding domain